MKRLPEPAASITALPHTPEHANAFWRLVTKSLGRRWIFAGIVPWHLRLLSRVVFDHTYHLVWERAFGEGRRTADVVQAGCTPIARHYIEALELVRQLANEKPPSPIDVSDFLKRVEEYGTERMALDLVAPPSLDDEESRS